VSEECPVILKVELYRDYSPTECPIGFVCADHYLNKRIKILDFQVDDDTQDVYLIEKRIIKEVIAIIDKDGIEWEV